MLKKTIKYEDFDGVTLVEDFHFHLTKAELVELEMSEKGGFGETLKAIVASNDNKAIIEHFQKIILMSYGKKSDDGKRFIKNPDLREEFKQTNAYSELFIELATNSDSAAEFINGVVPKGMAVGNAEADGVELATAPPVLETEDNRPAWEREDRNPTPKELQSMSREEMQRAMLRKNQQIATQ